MRRREGGRKEATEKGKEAERETRSGTKVREGGKTKTANSHICHHKTAVEISF